MVRNTRRMGGAYDPIRKAIRIDVVSGQLPFPPHGPEGDLNVGGRVNAQRIHLSGLSNAYGIYSESYNHDDGGLMHLYRPGEDINLWVSAYDSIALGFAVNKRMEFKTNATSGYGSGRRNMMLLTEGDIPYVFWDGILRSETNLNVLTQNSITTPEIIVPKISVELNKELSFIGGANNNIVLRFNDRVGELGWQQLHRFGRSYLFALGTSLAGGYFSFQGQTKQFLFNIFDNGKVSIDRSPSRPSEREFIALDVNGAIEGSSIKLTGAVETDRPLWVPRRAVLDVEGDILCATKITTVNLDATGDIELLGDNRGIILKDSAGVRRRIILNTDGTLSTSAPL